VQNDVLYALCHNHSSYFGSTLYAINSRTSRASKIASVGGSCFAACINHRDGKAYLVEPESLTVIDVLHDSVLRTIGELSPSYRHPADALCYADREDKIYCPCAETSGIVVVDGAGDSIRSRIHVGSSVEHLAYDSNEDRVYCSDYASLYVIDAARDSVVAAVPIGSSSYPTLLCRNPQDHKTYVASQSSNDVVVVGSDNEVEATVPLNASPEALCYDPGNDKIYCANHGRDGAGMTVIDGASDNVLAEIGIGNEFWDDNFCMCVDPRDNLIYCANSDDTMLTIVDGARDTVVATTAVGDEPVSLFYNPQDGLVYCANSNSGSISVLRSSAGIAEQHSFTTGNCPRSLGVVRGVLQVSDVLADGPKARYDLLDIGGRRVMKLQMGANDVQRLAPGVYFVREQLQATTLKPQTIQKVVLTK